jgi:signal transduction histidine kinase
MGTGKFNAHVNSALMGTDARALKEKDGSPLGQKVYDAAKEGTISTVNYNFPKPGGTDPVAKEAYVTRVGNEGLGVGYYK